MKTTIQIWKNIDANVTISTKPFLAQLQIDEKIGDTLEVLPTIELRPTRRTNKWRGLQQKLEYVCNFMPGGGVHEGSETQVG